MTKTRNKTLYWVVFFMGCSDCGETECHAMTIYIRDDANMGESCNILAIEGYYTVDSLTNEVLPWLQTHPLVISALYQCHSDVDSMLE